MNAFVIILSLLTTCQPRELPLLINLLHLFLTDLHLTECLSRETVVIIKRLDLSVLQDDVSDFGVGILLLIIPDIFDERDLLNGDLVAIDDRE